MPAPATLHAGALRHRIILQRPAAEKRGATGADITDFADAGECFASVEPLQGVESLLGDQMVARQRYLLTIRWSEGWSVAEPRWRIRWPQPQTPQALPDRILDIESVINVAQRDRWLQIIVTEIIKSPPGS